MIRAILKMICRLVFHVQVSCLANVPKEKKLLIIANHESFLDGLLLGLFLPIPLHSW